MRLSFVCHEFPPIGGGAASALDALTRVLAARGHEISILTVASCPRQVGENPDPYGRMITRVSAGRRSVLSPSIWELICSYGFMRRKVDAWVDAQEPDVLVAYFAFPSGFLSIRSARKRNLPLIVSFRGSDLPGFSRQRWGLLKRLQPFFLKAVWKHADVLCANGEHLFALAHQFQPSEKLRNIPNGVDTGLFTPPKNRPEDQEVGLLFVGQLIPRKRCMEILEGARKAAGEGVRIKLTFVGDGPLYSQLKVESGTLPETLCLELAGWMPREELPEIYRQHHALLQLSEAEGVSNVVLEALAAGLPVLGSSAALGCLRAPGESCPGVLIDPVSPDTIRNAILRFASDREFRNRCSRDARTFACGQSWKAKGREFEEMLEEEFPDLFPRGSKVCES